jgi:hypothetical protein
MGYNVEYNRSSSLESKNVSKHTKLINMKTFNYKRITRYFGYILLVAVFFSCSDGNQISKKLTESEFTLMMATYKKAWIDGANASTHSVQELGYFNDSIGRIKLQKDSLAFVGLFYGN